MMTLNYKLTMPASYMEILVLIAYSSYLFSFVTRILQAYVGGKGSAEGGFDTHTLKLFWFSNLKIKF